MFVASFLGVNVNGKLVTRESEMQRYVLEGILELSIEFLMVHHPPRARVEFADTRLARADQERNSRAADVALNLPYSDFAST